MFLTFFLLLGTFPLSAIAQEKKQEDSSAPPPSFSISHLENLIQNHHYQEASQQIRIHLQLAQNESACRMLDTYMQSMKKLDVPWDMDTFFEEQLSVARDNPFVLRKISQLYRHAIHTAFLENGKLMRTSKRATLDTEKRDKAISKILLFNAAETARQQGNMAFSAGCLLELANMMAASFDRPSNLPDFHDIPIPTIPDQQTFIPPYVPPPFTLFRVPPSFEQAANDGERILWLFSEAEQRDPELRDEVLLQQGKFLLGAYNFLPRFRLEDILSKLPHVIQNEYEAPLPAKDHQLRLVKETSQGRVTYVFTLPEECDALEYFNRISPFSEQMVEAASLLVREYASRGQQEKAEEKLKGAIALLQSSPDKHSNPATLRHLNNLLSSITQPRGCFLNNYFPIPEKDGIKYAFAYRNADQVKLNIQRLNLIDLIKEHMRAFRSQHHPRAKIEKLDYFFSNSNIINPLKNTSPLEESAANPVPSLEKDISRQSCRLNAPPGHQDTANMLLLPITRTGSYLVRAQVSEDCISYLLVNNYSIQAHCILTKKGLLWYISRTGSHEPIPSADIHLLCVGKDNATRNISGKTDAEGKWILQPAMKPGFHFMGWASDRKGNSCPILPAYCSELYEGAFPSPFHNHPHPPDAYKSSCLEPSFTITSQPAYQPGQTVHIKGMRWKTSATHPSPSQTARQRLKVKIVPQGGQAILEKNVTTDDWGEFELSYDLPDSVPMGIYTIETAPNSSRSPDEEEGISSWMPSSSFIVGDFRTQPFRVKVSASPDSSRAGSPIRIHIHAASNDYSQAVPGRVLITVQRNFRDFNCWRPVPHLLKAIFGNMVHHNMIELSSNKGKTPIVYQEEMQLNPEGSASLVFQPAENIPHHENYSVYHISADVIAETGKHAAGSTIICQPEKDFNIFFSGDRQFATTGKPFTVTITAARSNGAKIPYAKGKIELLRAKFTPDRLDNPNISEEPVACSSLETDMDGQATFTFIPPESGEYHLHAALEDSSGNIITSRQPLLSAGNGASFPFRSDYIKLTADRLTYQPGDTAKILVTSSQPDTWALLALRPCWKDESWKLVRLRNQQAIVEIPVHTGDIPNMHVEAFLPAMNTFARHFIELSIPPADKRLSIQINLEHPQEKANTSGYATILIRDEQGKAASGCRVTVALYDQPLSSLPLPSLTAFTWGRSNRLCWYDGEHNTHMYTRKDYLPDHSLNNPERQPFKKASCYEPLSGSLPVIPEGIIFPEERGFSTVFREFDGEHLQFSFLQSMVVDEPFTCRSLPPEFHRMLPSCIQWHATLTTDQNGKIRIPVKFPEHAAFWTIRAWARTKDLKTGETSVEIQTGKN